LGHIPAQHAAGSEAEHKLCQAKAGRQRRRRNRQAEAKQAYDSTDSVTLKSAFKGIVQKAFVEQIVLDF